MSLLAFGSYTARLKGLVERILATGSTAGLQEDIRAALDSGPRKALRDTVDIRMLRDFGAFFTGDALAARAINGTVAPLTSSDIIADPACGAGDLLVKCAQFLPLSDDLPETLVQWGKHLMGYDLHVEFVRATKARLFLAAIVRGLPVQPGTKVPLEECFPHICVGDYSEHLKQMAMATHIFVNPPYNTTTVDPGRSWASGKVSAAGVFMDNITAHAARGTRIVAILPDVLRSGRRYERWRTLLVSRSTVESIEVYGAFDRWTDVDVFVLRLLVDRISKQQGASWASSAIHVTGNQAVGELFRVHVGPVVPHRDPELGPVHPYLHARSAAPWQTVTDISETRAYQGTVFQPPFVVVRRTSAPRDLHRAVGTVVLTEEKVAVENHLVVLVPKDGSLSSCDRLINSLRMKETDDWLNQRIRCRHLTTGAVKELPLFA